MRCTQNQNIATLLLGAGAVAAAAGAAYVLLVRPWHLRWGTTNGEASGPLPGDELLPNPKLQATHAITIRAPAADVWPWLVQIGRGRGGFYSYTWLENLVGCRMRNAEHIVPEFQDLKVGDEIFFHPKAPPAKVTLLQPNRALVLGEAWAFVLKEIAPGVTRLIIRSRTHYKPSLMGFLGWRVVFEPAHFVMERKMMLTIKKLAEARAAARDRVSPARPVETGVLHAGAVESTAWFMTTAGASLVA